jgi:ribosomal protein S18 acetylase RimI-like enzyme
MDLRWMGPADADAVLQAAVLFDEPPTTEWTARFLEEPGHHLCIAYESGAPAGFVSGVEMTHPDKGTEMFLYELSVGEEHRRRGVGRALTEALASLARERGCFGMWVGTESDNEAARATYESAGAPPAEAAVFYTWTFGDPQAP